MNPHFRQVAEVCFKNAVIVADRYHVIRQESPFTDKGSVVEIFTDLTLWMRIRKTIEQVNANAVA